MYKETKQKIAEELSSLLGRDIKISHMHEEALIEILGYLQEINKSEEIG